MSEIKVPFSRALTVFLTKDMPASQAQADADLQAVEDGSQVFVHPTNEAYFHRLRRRVAEKPELLGKIVVFYQDENAKLSEVDLTFEDELHWPPGFGCELWDEEIEIMKARYARGETTLKPRRSFKEIRELFAQKHPIESLFFERWLKEIGESFV